MRGMMLVALAVLLTALSLALVGCGGGGKGAPSQQSGSVTLTVKFPARPSGPAPAFIPLATNSFRIRITDPETGDPLVPDVVIPRGSEETETVTIDEIRAGDIKIKVWAYTSYDGTGDPVAQAEALATITQGETTTVRMVLGALPYRVEVTPATLLDAIRARDTSAGLVLEKGTTGQLVATVYDVDGNVILGSFTFIWDSDDEKVATVDSTGLVTAIDPGTCTVTATETSSGKSGSCGVEVWARVPVRATVSPAEVSLQTGSSVDLTATAYDALGNPIPYAVVQTWSSTDNAKATVVGSGNTATATAGTTLGDVDIIADYGGGVSAKCLVHVVSTGGVIIIIE